MISKIDSQSDILLISFELHSPCLDLNLKAYKIWAFHQLMIECRLITFIIQIISVSFLFLRHTHTGDNYPSWSRSMMIAFSIKNKVDSSMDPYLNLLFLKSLITIHGCAIISLLFRGFSISFPRKSQRESCLPILLRKFGTILRITINRYYKKNEILLWKQYVANSWNSVAKDELWQNLQRSISIAKNPLASVF